MRKYIILTLFLLAGHQGFTQPFAKGLLWKISGNGLSEPSFVFGTIHMICPEAFVVFPGTQQALAQSRQIVLELDFTDPQLMMGIQMGMLMQNNTEIKDLLTHEDYQFLSTFMSDSLGMQVGFVGRIQPFFLLSMTFPHMIQCQPKSYEEFFVNKAKEMQLPVKGLETLQEQLNVFAAMSYTQQAEMLLETLRDYNKQRQELQQLVDTYLTQDLLALNQLFLKSQSKHEEFNRRLMEERNLRWIPRMEAIMQQTPTFFAVGAGHFTGEHSILDLLAQQGYTVERLE